MRGAPQASPWCGGLKRAWRAALTVGLLLVPLAAGAEEEERWDHRGALGLLVGGGIDFKREVKAGGETEEGRRGLLETLLTFPLGLSGNEWTVGARTGFGGPAVDVAIAGGLRAYFGDDRFKTYLTAELALHVTPNVTAGPRLGVGIQYELFPVFGLYLGGAAEVTAGQGIRIAGALVGGIQLRTYIFE
ncbi:MAG TPA: hypothetical protein VLT82_01080 [Myxococcaceae bacterium]|nr:hypothetical protein [Myxococcaceae bacterium]